MRHDNTPNAETIRRWRFSMPSSVRRFFKSSFAKRCYTPPFLGRFLQSIHVRAYFHLLIATAFLPIFIAIYYLGYWLRFEGQLSFCEWESFRCSVGWVVFVKLAWFAGLRVCRGWRRPVSFYDLGVLLSAAGAAAITVILIYYLLVPYPFIPRSVLVFDWVATIVVVGGLRSLLRGWREVIWLLSRPAGQVRVLIAGAEESGALMLRAIRQTGRPKYRVVGFIGCDAKLVGMRIEGLPIVGVVGEMSRLVQRYAAQQVIVAQEEFSGEELRKIIDQAQQNQFDVRVLPGYRQLIDGNLIVQPQPVSIEDLLRRKTVKLDVEDIRQWIDGQTILVTGSAGSIGSEICRQLLQFSPRRIVALDRSETGQFFLEQDLKPLAKNARIDLVLADVLDQDRLSDILHRHLPQVIFHAAAYKHVPLMEKQPGEAVKNIVTATRRLAELAMKSAVSSFVLISTDKAVNPSSVMGACKRVAELYVQSLSGRSQCRFATVRFGNVLDSAGSVVQVFRRQIASGGPLTVTHPDIRRYFMTISEAARLVIQAGAIGKDGQILLLDMGEPIRIIDLAADMIRLSGLRVGDDVRIQIVGLRPGEKMFEELHAADEQRLHTSHPKIIVAQGNRLQSDALPGNISELERLALTDPHKISAQLHEIVPEYCDATTILPFSQQQQTYIQEGRVAA
jgi:FlaA1/EpsC-like NDP-sugar epimerase